ECPLPVLCGRGRDGAAFERVRRIARVILDANLPCANRTFQVLRSPQRSVTWCEVDDCAVVEHGKELAIPPQSVRPVCQKTTLEGGSNRVDLVPNFERPETRFTYRKLDRRIFRPAFPPLHAAHVPRDRPS